MRELPLSDAPKLTAAEKLRITLELAEVGYEMMRENLRRRHPDESEEQIQERLTAWLHHRPGAEYGDCVGRPVRPSWVPDDAWADSPSRAESDS